MTLTSRENQSARGAATENGTLRRALCFQGTRSPALHVRGHETRGASHPNPKEARSLTEAEGTGAGGGPYTHALLRPL